MIFSKSGSPACQSLRLFPKQGCFTQFLWFHPLKPRQPRHTNVEIQSGPHTALGRRQSVRLPSVMSLVVVKKISCPPKNRRYLRYPSPLKFHRSPCAIHFVVIIWFCSIKWKSATKKNKILTTKWWSITRWMSQKKPSPQIHHPKIQAS